MQTSTAKPIKVYVAVKTDFSEDGTMLPREITWEDDERFIIERILDIRQAPALKAGGQGDRYTILIKGKQSYLFLKEVRTLPVTTLVDGLWREKYSLIALATTKTSTNSRLLFLQSK